MAKVTYDLGHPDESGFAVAAQVWLNNDEEGERGFIGAWIPETLFEEEDLADFIRWLRESLAGMQGRRALAEAKASRERAALPHVTEDDPE